VNIFNLPKKFLPFLDNFVHFNKKAILKKLGFQLLERLIESGHFCPFSIFYIKLFLIG